MRLLSLSRQDIGLLTISCVAQFALALMVRLVGVPNTLASVARCRERLQRSVHASDERVAWAIEATGRRLALISTCLVRALAADMLLNANGRPGQLTIGVRRAATGELESHAWFEREGRILVGARGACEYVPFMTL